MLRSADTIVTRSVYYHLYSITNDNYNLAFTSTDDDNIIKESALLYVPVGCCNGKSRNAVMRFANAALFTLYTSRFWHITIIPCDIKLDNVAL